MNIIITGGAGFIGSHLTKSLITKGHKVTIIDSFQNFAGADFNLNLRYRKQLIKGANLITDKASKSSNILKKDTILIHLAAIPIINPKNGDFFNENVLETDLLLKNALEAGVKKVIFISSVYAYGTRKKREYKETDILEPYDLYGLSKTFGEYLVRNIFKNREWVIIRTAGVYGFGDHNLRISQRIVEFEKLKLSLSLTDGAVRSFIYINDLVDGLIRCVDSNVKNQVFNLTGQTITLDQFAHISKQYVPTLTWDLRKKPKGEVNMGSASITKAKKMLGFKVNYSIEDGIKDYLLVMKKYSS